MHNKFKILSLIRNGLIVSIIIALILSQSGLVIWQGVKNMSYQYVRQHNTLIKTRDTLRLNVSTLNQNEDIVWLEHDEIRYKNKMFDVKLMSRNGNTLTLIGHYDKFENQLFKLLNKLVDTKNGNSNNSQKSQTFVVFDAIIPNNNYSYYPTPIFIKPVHILLSSKKHQSIKPDTDLQPPDSFTV